MHSTKKLFYKKVHPIGIVQLFFLQDVLLRQKKFITYLEGENLKRLLKSEVLKTLQHNFVNQHMWFLSHDLNFKKLCWPSEQLQKLPFPCWISNALLQALYHKLVSYLPTAKSFSINYVYSQSDITKLLKNSYWCNHSSISCNNTSLKFQEKITETILV